MVEPASSKLQQHSGLVGLIVNGLGSIVGAGAFIGIGVAAEIAGAGMIAGIAIGAMIAMGNGFNSIQLVVHPPIHSSSYHPDRQYPSPLLGFMAGWTAFLAMTASAATAALGGASYFLVMIGLDGRGLIVPVALGAVIVATTIALSSIPYSHQINTSVAILTIGSLLLLILAGLPTAIAMGSQLMTPMIAPASGAAINPIVAILQASALLAMAYPDYGRILTLDAPEVAAIDPEHTIPRAIVVTLMITLVLYLSLSLVSVAIVGAPILSAAVTSGAPLEFVAHATGIPGLPQLVGIAATVAMWAMGRNLIVSSSQLLWAMGRSRNTRSMAELNSAKTTSYRAVSISAVAIALLVSVADIKTAWSLGAFTGLICAAITTMQTLQLPSARLLYPRWLAWAGLVACLFLAGWVDRQHCLTGLGLLAIGLVWYWIMPTPQHGDG